MALPAVPGLGPSCTVAACGDPLRRELRPVADVATPVGVATARELATVVRDTAVYSEFPQVHRAERPA